MQLPIVYLLPPIALASCLTFPPFMALLLCTNLPLMILLFCMYSPSLWPYCPVWPYLKFLIPLPIVTDRLGPTYGRQPRLCNKQNATLCHGPHLYEEWWIGPLSGRPEDLQGWLLRCYVCLHTTASYRKRVPNWCASHIFQMLSDSVHLWVGLIEAVRLHNVEVSRVCLVVNVINMREQIYARELFTFDLCNTQSSFAQLRQWPSHICTATWVEQNRKMHCGKMLTQLFLFHHFSYKGWRRPYRRTPAAPRKNRTPITPSTS